MFWNFCLSSAPDEAPCQASGWRRGCRKGDQGASVLPLDRLGPSGTTGDTATVQTQNCQLKFLFASVCLFCRHFFLSFLLLFTSFFSISPHSLTLLSVAPFHQLFHHLSGFPVPSSHTESSEITDRTSEPRAAFYSSICKCMSSLARRMLVSCHIAQWWGTAGGSWLCSGVRGQAH